MKLIADSGSTKTEWGRVGDSGCQSLFTQGINPFHQDGETIRQILTDELLPQLNEPVTEIYFYGAGCTKEASPKLKTILEDVFHCPAEVNSDMLGAARALLQKNAGIACILGTGANSCYYDGREIVKNVSPLGYILGDEGSGAYIGKCLVGDILKEQFSPSTCQLFFDETSLTAADIINKVYRQPMPNRFLGQVSQFCQHHLDIPEVKEFVMDCFRQFFIRNIDNYIKNIPDASHTCSFVGSVAWAYEDVIRQVASSFDCEVSTIMRNPLQGMVQFHTN